MCRRTFKAQAFVDELCQELCCMRRQLSKAKRGEFDKNMRGGQHMDGKFHVREHGDKRPHAGQDN